MARGCEGFDLIGWAAPVVAPPPPRKPQRHKSADKFVKGPIPLAWIDRAASLPGKALAVGMALWFESGCTGERKVKMTLARLQRTGISEGAARRGLRALESVGLVSVFQKPGCASVVTIQEAPGITPSSTLSEEG
jgi:hypothetical protein